MPILYIHGVNVRSRDGFFELEPKLRKFIAPVIADDPENVLIEDVFWGKNHGVKLAFDGISRPRTRLLRQGAGDGEALPGTVEPRWSAIEHENVLDKVPAQAGGSGGSGGLTSGRASRPAAKPPARLRDLDDDDLADVLALILQAEGDSAERRAELTFAADQLAHDPAFRARLNGAASSEQELDIIFDALKARIEDTSGLTGMGFGDWLGKARERLGEVVGRAVDLPTYAISVALAELRGPLNDMVSIFLGDVFVYLDKRQDEDERTGAIPGLAIEKLKLLRENQLARGNEPIVLLTHSMGGQIGYDMVTYFLPNDPALGDIKIDFWCAAASQVGFFEEAKLFIESKPEHRTGDPVPFPSNRHLGTWWNVWDYNDFLSFSAEDIIEGIDDESYDSGNSLLAAHGGYFERPSFYRRFAKKLDRALESRGGAV